MSFQLRPLEPNRSALDFFGAELRYRVSKAGVQISKAHPDSVHKIDALVAAVLAHEARADAIAAGVVANPAEMGGFTF